MKGGNKYFKDGTSQKDRMSPALDPGYVSVEERGLEELLKFARRYAEKLKFFNTANQPDGDWSGLFDFDDQELKELASFVEDPESFSEDAEKYKKFSRPHLVLFLAFLKLLEHPRRQFRELTARHLDYYYKKILKLKEKPEKPDKLHVVFQLADSVSQHLLKQGTRLDAGKDDDGLDLVYALEKDITLNRARVGRAAGVRLEQKERDGKLETIAFHSEIFYDPDDPEKKDIQKFPPFKASSNQGEDKKSSFQYRPGLALFSPLFELIEGEREISLKFECEKESFRAEVLEKIIEKEPRPFEIFLNTSEGWLKAEKTTFKVGDLATGDPLEKYPEELDLIFSSDKPVESGYNYLCFPNGCVYEIIDSPKETKFSALSAGREAGGGKLRLYKSITPRTLIAKIDATLTIKDGKLTGDKDCFKKNYSGRFIRLRDGRIFQIKKFDSATQTEVIYRGKTKPDSNTALLSEKIEFGGELKDFKNTVEISEIRVKDDCQFTKKEFTEKDKGRLILWDNGQTLKIKEVASSRKLNVKAAGLTPQSGHIGKYNPSSIYFNALYFQITLGKEFPELRLDPAEPNIKILLKAADKNRDFYFDQFKSLKLKKVAADVKVKDLQNARLRNDISLLDPKTPFELFGHSPKPGSSFYFFNREICSKKLTYLKLTPNWQGLPEDFETYYKSYPTKDGALDFKAKLSIFDRRSWRDIEEQELFEQNENPYLEFNLDGCAFKRVNEVEDPLEGERFFKLELGERDFMHDLYSSVQSMVAFRNAKAEKETDITAPPNQPYTPLVKSISFDYAAAAELDFSKKESDQAEDIAVFHLHPFGCQKLSDATSLLPFYEPRGQFYIGLKDLNPPQNVSLFFQLAAVDSGYEDAVPEIRWSYLSRSDWLDFQNDEILSDTTRDLLNTGILQFSVPEKAISDSSLAPSGMIWLKAELAGPPESVPDVVDIKTQAATAVFQSREEPSAHLSRPLAADSVKGLSSPDPAVKSLSQPYSSFKGRPAENPKIFYTRAAERLRHKQRAVTPWDYERLVLENFPEIYKVKCLKGSELENSAGKDDIVIVVIPDISNAAPFFPLEPKAPAYLLEEVKSRLSEYSSPFVKLKVKNPRYHQARYRFWVKFKSGADQGYCLKQLNEDLKRFLSPWAYKEGADISFGGGVHSSAVTHFIEKLPYVDYIAGLKLIESSLDGVNPPAGSQKSGWTGKSAADAIVVSAPVHIIDLIKGDERESFEGIGHMMIEVDFALDPETETDYKKLGFMEIGKDFEVFKIDQAKRRTLGRRSASIKIFRRKP